MKSNNLVIEASSDEGLKYLLKNQHKFDLCYIDPPYSTGNVFTYTESRKNAVSNSRSGNIAYNDKFNREDYLSFLETNIKLAYELLSEQGSFYLHIDYKVGHYVKILLDNIFGEKNYINEITRIKSNPKNFYRKGYGNIKDCIFFYSKTGNHIWNDVREDLTQEDLKKRFNKYEENSGRFYTTVPIHAPGETTNGESGKKWKGVYPPEGRHWRVSPSELTKLDNEGLIEWSSNNNPRMKKYADESKGKKIQDIWNFKDPQYPKYPTEKNLNILDRIVRNSSNKDSMVLDFFAGSGTTGVACAKNERGFVLIDQSEIAIDTIKSRLTEESSLTNKEFDTLKLDK
jgi:adenine-specific DNA-methyltransferase